MHAPEFYLTMAAAALAGLAMVTLAGLSVWRGWLQLRLQQLTRYGEPSRAALPDASARIEMADLKERIRKLEAIAAGVDL